MKKLLSFPLSIVRQTSSQYNKSFHAKLFTLFASSESEVYTFSQEHEPHYRYCFAFMEKDEGQWFLDIHGIARIRKWVLRGARRSTGHVVRLYRTWLERFEAYKKLANALLSTDLSGFSDRALFAEFRRFYKSYLGVGSIAYISDSFMSTGTEDWLESLMSKELRRVGIEGDVAGKVRLLTSPVHLSFILEEEYELMRVAVALDAEFPRSLPTYSVVVQRSPRLIRLLTAHERRYHWIHNNYFNVKFVGATAFYRRARSTVLTARRRKSTVRQLFKEKSQELSEFRQKREQLLQSMPISRYHRNILDIAKLFAKWKDVRKSGVYMGMYHFDRFLKEIAKRKNIPLHNLTYICFDEMRSVLLENKSITKTVRDRKRRAFFAVTDKGYFIAGGQKAAAYFRYFMRGQSTEASVIRGVAASPGFARGLVRIIRKTDEMRLFRRGQVLVANQTTPEFVPIMKKASAIITEQGGITSHAAVVSRELGKPCVIGTKIATQVLKDGDLVEVDATKGIVRKL